MTGANFLSEEVKGKSEEVENCIPCPFHMYTIVLLTHARPYGFSLLGTIKREGMEALPYTGSLV